MAKSVQVNLLIFPFLIENTLQITICIFSVKLEGNNRGLYNTKQKRTKCRLLYLNKEMRK